MPEISRFFGMIIYMDYNDHPPPHFHVRYGNQRATELMANWELARQNQPLEMILPLE
jgi:hypothetical protein